MTRRKKTIISLLLFTVIFAALLLAATFTDLQVSNILTKNALAEHTYYTNDPFGTVFECIGSAPVYFMLAFSFQILFWYMLRGDKKGRGAVAAFLMVASTIAYYAFASSVVEYFLQHLEAERFEDAAFLKGVEWILAGACTFFATMAVRNYSEESVKKLVRFAFAMICVAALANILVAVVKIPVGRMRYRAMNTRGGQSIGGFDNFTPWYVLNGQMDDNEMLRLFGTTDACKSFPSGHTCAAGMSYGLIMLIEALNIKCKGKKALLWLCPILYTTTVAISRIVVGAHFFSDVLMGGTISFVSMIIFREIFLCKGANVKSIFKAS